MAGAPQLAEGGSGGRVVLAAVAGVVTLAMVAEWVSTTSVYVRVRSWFSDPGSSRLEHRTHGQLRGLLEDVEGLESRLRIVRGGSLGAAAAQEELVACDELLQRVQLRCDRAAAELQAMRQMPDPTPEQLTASRRYRSTCRQLTERVQALLAEVDAARQELKSS